MDRAATVAGYEELISRNSPWDLWATITFAKPRSLAEAKKDIRHFMKNLNTHEEIFINNFVICFIVYERNSLREIHIHMLIRGIHPLKAERFQARCKARFGESKVMPYHAHIQPNATLYLANKYLSSALVDSECVKLDPRIRKASLMRRTRIQL